MKIQPDTILIVDDTPSSLEVASDCLTDAGFEILVAQDGASGLEIARQAQPNLILLDVMMPGMDGIETCRRLKADQRVADIPVIFMTALAETDHKVKGFGAGAVDYITKPVQVDELLVRVQTHLTLHHVQKRLEAQNQRLQVEIQERQLAEEKLQQAHDMLEQRVAERTNELWQANAQLKAEIEERRQAEEALRKSEEKYRSIMQNMQEGYFEVDLTGNLTFFNDAACGMLGYTSQELMGMNNRAYMDNASARRVYKVFNKVYSEGKPAQAFQWEIIRKDGRKRLIDASVSLIRDRLGQRTGFRGVVRDVTERKLSEAEIRRRNLELALLNRIIAASLSETSAKVILETACRELALAFNLPRAAAFLLNSDKMEVTGVAEFMIPDADRNLQDVPSMVDMVLDVTHNALARELLGKRAPVIINDALHDQQMAFVHEMLSRRGTRAVLIAPLILNAEVVGCICLAASEPNSFSDEQARLAQSVADQVSGVLARIQLNEERHQLEEQYHQAQKMEAIGKLTGGVAHDFNNILTVIMGVCDLMALHQSPGTPLRMRVDQIQEATMRAAGLVRQLMAFSRQQVLQPQLLNLNEAVSNFEKMLRRVIGEDIALQTLFDPQLGMVKADPGQIDQVLMNLVVNARDAMPKGGSLTIETANADLDDNYARRHVGVTPGHYIRLTVSDTGAGMDDQIQAHIFEPFFTTKAKGEGTGLGLSTVYGIVTQSGGHIWVYSEPGHGTSFKIYLPQVQSSSAEDAQESVEMDVSGGCETVLVVEDDDVVREMVCETLAIFGYNVLEADCGAKAQKICEDHPADIHLLLTDVIMPGGQSGTQLAEVLTTRYENMAVLYMSGYTDNAIAQHGLLEPGYAFIQKPFVAKELAAKVRQVLDQAAGETTTA